ncbi:hypothetical protein SUGI_0454120 [Cryptomeria japonica]|nr:hypothetical protein SUGI_0454120 [Cryptomeria japonica]
MDTMWVLGLVVGLFPLFIWLLISFNDWRYCLTSNKGAKLPPGNMGCPIIGELITFLWHFKFMGTPDKFIWNRIAKYGNTGIYRTHLFGSPSIITCSPEFNRFVMGTETENGSFIAGWPCPRLFGEQSINMVEGGRHKRLRRFLLEAINKPESLPNIIIRLQPAFKDSFENWVVKGKFSAVDEIRSLAFSNICSLLISFQRSPMLENMERMYRGLLAGMRASPINMPGTAFHYSLQVIDELFDLQMWQTLCLEQWQRIQNLMVGVY